MRREERDGRPKQPTTGASQITIFLPVLQLPNATIAAAAALELARSQLTETTTVAPSRGSQANHSTGYISGGPLLWNMKGGICIMGHTKTRAAAL